MQGWLLYIRYGVVCCLSHLEASLRYVIGLVSGFSVLYYLSFSLCSPSGGVALAQCCFWLSELLAPRWLFSFFVHTPWAVWHLQSVVFCYQNCKPLGGVLVSLCTPLGGVARFNIVLVFVLLAPGGVLLYLCTSPGGVTCSRVFFNCDCCVSPWWHHVN